MYPTINSFVNFAEYIAINKKKLLLLISFLIFSTIHRSSHTENVNRESILSSEKSSPFDGNACFGYSRSQKTKKKLLSVSLYVSFVDTITFKGVIGSEQNLVGVFVKCSSGIEIQSIILILIRISILTKTIRNDTECEGYLQNI